MLYAVDAATTLQRFATLANFALQRVRNANGVRRTLENDQAVIRVIILKNT
jgi:hypothetical protein